MTAVMFEKWSGRLDSNQRPHAPQACALPGCATSRLPEFTIVQRTNCQTCNTKTHRKQSRKRHKKHSLRLALRFVLLQQREQLPQLCRKLLQSLSLFRRCRRRTRNKARRSCEAFSVGRRRLTYYLTIFIAVQLQLPATTQLIRESLLRTGDRVLVLVKQLLDSQGHFHVALTVDTLPGAVLLRREHRKFRLPVAQDMRLHPREFANLADLEKKFLGYSYSRTTHALKISIGVAELALVSGVRESWKSTASVPAARSEEHTSELQSRLHL